MSNRVAWLKWKQKMKMCWVTSRDRYPPWVKAPLYLIIHMCPTAKVHESVGRLAKLAVRPRKFSNHKKTRDFEYK